MVEHQASSLTIMLVKNADVTSVPAVRDLLRGEGHEVIEAGTVEDLIDRALDYTSSVRPDLILMDVDSLSGDEFSSLASFCRETDLREIPLLGLSRSEGRIGSVPPPAHDRAHTRMVDQAHLPEILGTLLRRRAAAAA